MTPEEMRTAVADALRNYGDIVLEDLEDVIQTLAKEAAKRVRAGAPKAGCVKPKGNRTKHYKQMITYRTAKDVRNQRSAVVYAGRHEYSLTHLLEYGHKTRLKAGHKGKSKTAPIKHWKTGEEYVLANFEKALIKKIKGEN